MTLQISVPNYRFKVWGLWGGGVGGVGELWVKIVYERNRDR